jgi:hypothetical protein
MTREIVIPVSNEATEQSQPIKWQRAEIPILKWILNKSLVS